jgi:tRNA threonylcarbamoyladenosine biosynthesis protein TsaB
MFPRILFIDSVSPEMIIKLYHGGKVLQFMGNPKNRNTNDKILNREVLALLKKANISFSDLDAYAVAVGPGSFTGIRVGIAAVKAYHMIHPKSIIAISGIDNSLEKFAQAEFTDIADLKPIYGTDFVVNKKN